MCRWVKCTFSHLLLKLLPSLMKRSSAKDLFETEKSRQDGKRHNNAYFARTAALKFISWRDRRVFFSHSTTLDQETSPESKWKTKHRDYLSLPLHAWSYPVRYINIYHLFRPLHPLMRQKLQRITAIGDFSMMEEEAEGSNTFWSPNEPTHSKNKQGPSYSPFKGERVWSNLFLPFNM